MPKDIIYKLDLGRMFLRIISLAFNIAKPGLRVLLRRCGRSVSAGPTRSLPTISLTENVANGDIALSH